MALKAEVGARVQVATEVARQKFLGLLEQKVEAAPDAETEAMDPINAELLQKAHVKLKQWKPELEEETIVEAERQRIEAELAAKAAKKKKKKGKKKDVEA